MKKIILYIVLFFIIIVFVFFLFNYKPNSNNLLFAYEEHMKLDKDEVLINPVTKEVVWNYVERFPCVQMRCSHGSCQPRSKHDHLGLH